MLIYNSLTGVLARNNRVIGIGYSGHDAGLNNPFMEGVARLGPVPRGLYHMGPPRQSPNTGRYTMNLDPIGHNAKGRTLLRMHGDNRWLDKSASHGCIVMPFAVRVRANEENPDHLLTVI